MQAIYILWLRQIKKYSRSKARIIGSLGQPLLFLLAFGFGFGPIFAKAGGGNYINFLAPGIIGMSIIFSAMFAGIEVIWDRQFGFLKETLVAPVSRTSIVIGRTLGGASIALFQGIVVFIISLFVGFKPVSLIHLPLVLIVMFLTALLFTAVGTAIATRMRDMQAFPIIMNFIMMPLFFLSGSLFPLEGLPPGLNIVIKYNPLSYAMDVIRGLFSGVYHFSLGTDLLVTVSVTVFSLVIATILFTKIEA
jgi:ABC-2 type transport system permease protein